MRWFPATLRIYLYLRWVLLRKKLGMKEVPFFLTLFIAWAGWAVAHVADRVLESPTIEYRLAPNVEGDEKTFRVFLTNLSRQAFFGLMFEIEPHGINGIDTCKPFASDPPPIWAWDEAPGPEKKPGKEPAKEPAKKGIRFQLAQLHPGWETAICVKFKGNQAPTFMLREVGLKGNPKQAVRLVEPSFETWFVRHELLLMLILASFWLIPLICWLLWPGGVKR